MSPFFAGIIFGALLAGSVFILFITRQRRPKPREIEPWSEDTYQAPVVKTRIVNRHRSFDI